VARFGLAQNDGVDAAPLCPQGYPAATRLTLDSRSRLPSGRIHPSSSSHEELAMPRTEKFKVDLNCPSCGRTGVASITTVGTDTPGTASATDGFLVRLGPDNSMTIACSECMATAYEAE